MISTAQDRCRALYPHGALELVHTLALTQALHQGDGAHQEGAQEIVDAEVQVIVATAREPAATPIGAAALAEIELRGLIIDGDECKLSLISAPPTKSHAPYLFMKQGDLRLLRVTQNSFEGSRLLKD